MSTATKNKSAAISKKQGEYYHVPSTAGLKGNPARRAKQSSILSGLKLGVDAGASHRSVTPVDAILKLQALRGRGEIMLASQPAKLKAFTEFVDESVESLQDEDQIKAKAELIAAAQAGDQEAQVLLAEVTRRTIGQVLMPSASWGNFLELVNLGEEDVFTYETRFPKRSEVTYIGPDGAPEVQKVTQDFSLDKIPFSLLATEDMEYPLMDLQNGTAVKGQALATLDLVGDIVDKIDGIVQASMIVGGTGSLITANFDFTNEDLALRHVVAGNRVNTANFPVGNLIALADNAAATVPRLGLLHAVIAYATQWGDGAFPDGELRPAAIHIPSAHAWTFLQEIAADSPDNTYAENLLSQGFIRIRLGNFEFTIVADNTLDPNTDPHAYVRFNKPVGFLVDKPGLAQTIVDESPRLRKQNVGRVCATRVMGFAMPKQWAVNMLAVRYRDL